MESNESCCSHEGREVQKSCSHEALTKITKITKITRLVQFFVLFVFFVAKKTSCAAWL